MREVVKKWMSIYHFPHKRSIILCHVSTPEQHFSWVFRHFIHLIWCFVRNNTDKESSSEKNLRTNSLQEEGNDRGLSQDFIQEELEDEHLQFKGPMIRARSKRLKDKNYSRLLMLQAI